MTLECSKCGKNPMGAKAQYWTFINLKDKAIDDNSKLSLQDQKSEENVIASVKSAYICPNCVSVKEVKV